MNAGIRSLFMVAAFAAASLCVALPARAQQQPVLWGSPVGVPSETSGGAGAPVNASFTFQLGAFFENGESGWTPSAANTGEWADHWLSADSAAYNEAFKTFTGACRAEAAFAGARGYIWGFDSKSRDGEWILVTDPSWVFPSGPAPLAFPLSWQTSGATSAIVGTIENAPGAAFHMKTAAVAESPPPWVPGEQWLGMHFTPAQLAQPLIAAWAADPDEDGLSNLLEMAVGAPPGIWSGRQNQPEMEYIGLGGNHYLALRIRRAPNVAAILGAEVSSDMTHWESGAGEVSVVSDGPDELVIRDNTPVEADAQRFIRLKVTLEDGE
jgi:hypothetical protein